MRGLGFLARAAALLSVLLLSGCEYYDKPNRPLPANLSLTTLDGATLTREELVGKPWVINLWVPG